MKTGGAIGTGGDAAMPCTKQSIKKITLSAVLA